MTRENGASLVEFVVALPVLLVVLMGTIDFGRVFYLSMALTTAARAGAQWGAHSGARSGDIPGMRAAALAASPTVTGIDATPTQTCECTPDNGSSFTAAASCTSPCPSGQHMLVFVSVVATKPFTTLSRIPGIPRTLTISRMSRLRVLP
jgi:Flp pilus assembly protein TadG